MAAELRQRISYLRILAANMEKITFGTDIPGYVYGPADAANVIVLQEWWGHTEELEQQAMALSKRGGYRVLIPDLYKGNVGVTAEEAGHLMNSLDWPAARDEMSEAVKYLSGNGKKVGVTGFCMGGALALIAAQHSGVAAAAPFYGVPEEGICQLEKIQVPVLMQFGKEDDHKGFSDPEAANKAYEKMKSAGVDVELHMYDDVGHAFMNGFTDRSKEVMKELGFPRPDNIEAIQSKAWERLLAFFEKHVK